MRPFSRYAVQLESLVGTKGVDARAPQRVSEKPVSAPFLRNANRQLAHKSDPPKAVPSCTRRAMGFCDRFSMAFLYFLVREKGALLRPLQLSAFEASSDSR